MSGRRRSALAVSLLVLIVTLGASSASASTDVIEPPPATPSQLPSQDSAAGARRDQSDSDALAVAQRVFPTVFDGRAWRALRLRGDERLVRIAGPRAALVERAGSDRLMLVESSVPLSVDGELIDLSLGRRGEEFAPAHPLAPLRISGNSAAGALLERPGVALRVLGRDRPGRQVGDSVFYGNVDVDSDLLVSPVPGGFETWSVLRSPDSPEELSLVLDVPDGAQIESASDWPGALVIRRDGEELARLGPPTAHDANGQPVEVRPYSVGGTTVTFRVVHRTADVAYPILVDPLLVESYSFDGAQGCGDWTLGTDTSAGRIEPGCGNLYLGSGFDFQIWSAKQMYQGDTRRVLWTLRSGTRNETYISRVDFQRLRNDAPNGWPCQFAGLSDANGWSGYYMDGPGSAVLGTKTWTTCGYWGPVDRTHCAFSDCRDAGPVGNNVQWGATMGTTWFSAGWAVFMDGASVFVGDATAPASAYVHRHTGLPTGWVHAAEPSVVLTGSDNGLGVKRFELVVPQVGGGTKTYTRSHSCSGAKSNPCLSRVYSDGSGVSGESFTYPTSQMPEGVNTIRGRVRDAVNNSRDVASWTVKVDRSIPDVFLSGSLWDHRDQTLDHGVYHLRARAEDGSAAAPRSGVKNISIEVNGVREAFTLDQACEAGSCPLTLDWDFSTARPPGLYTIKIISDDQLGHRRERSFDVFVPDGCADVHVDPAGLAAPLKLDTPVCSVVQGTSR